MGTAVALGGFVGVVYVLYKWGVREKKKFDAKATMNRPQKAA
jgi:hypothetical protein